MSYYNDNYNDNYDHDYDYDYDEEQGSNTVYIIIGIIILLIILGIGIYYYYTVVNNKNNNILDIIDPIIPENSKDIDINETSTLEQFRYNLTPGTGHWNYLYIDNRILDKIELNGYTTTGVKILINVHPVSEFSEKVTLYANTANKTGGYIIGDGEIPSGSIPTAVFYTKDGGRKHMLVDFNGSINICDTVAGFASRQCTGGTNRVDINTANARYN